MFACNRFCRFFILAAGLTLGVSAAWAEKTEPKTLTFAADLWCPLNCEEDAPQPGIAVELLKAIYEPLGYKVNYVVMPWARAMESARTNTIDGIIAASKTDTPDFIFPNEPLSAITDDFYVRADSPLIWKGLDSLKGHPIGIIRGYTYGDKTQAFLDNAEKTSGMVQPVGGDDAVDQNIRKLLAGRVDVIVEYKTVFDYTLMQQHLTDKIKRLDGSIPALDVYIAFAPTNPQATQLTKHYDAGVLRLQKDGTLTRIFASYGLKQ